MECVNVQLPPSRTPVCVCVYIYCPGHAGIKGSDRADRPTGKNHKWLASWKLWCVEELETLYVKPRPAIDLLVERDI